MSARRLGIAVAIGLTPVVLALAGCSRETSVVCSGSTAYLTAVEDGPLRVPDGLTVPDEIEALRIPGRATAAASDGAGQATASSNCLELSPAFSVPAGQ